ncbi:DEAD/DEAH box helicase family protein [candidate division KSB1 bacterium]|nr:DEAD/DEAH box helicase family protein [candidate division KSB1 bacterium]
MQNIPELHFHGGILIFENWSGEEPPPFFRWDERQRKWRAWALAYSRILAALKHSGIVFKDKVSKIEDLNLGLQLEFDPYSYQKEALGAWDRAAGLRSVVLPTGAGKSFVALKAMELTRKSTLIVTPTLDLMNQWYGLIRDAFGIEVGILGGGYHEVKTLTVSTYDSAYLYMDRYGDRFGLLIFDEVHHLPSPKNSHIPQMAIAPYRLGLTATYQRLDNRQKILSYLIGGVVYRKTIKELKGEHLSEYEIHRIGVELTPEEREEYEVQQVVYQRYVKEKKVRFFGGGWGKFIRESAYEADARRALLARVESRRIMLGAEKKLAILDTLLKQHHGDRVIVFTENNDLVYKISREFLIPAITHHTRTVERKQILDNFRQGVYRLVVTSKVLNEGVDVPEANVAIILSGSASPREHLQRLGRILRKRSGKKALLYEVVSKGTVESQVSYRRRRGEAYQLDK